MRPEGSIRPGLGIFLTAAAASMLLLVSAAYSVLFAPAGEGSGAVLVRVAPGDDLAAITRALHAAGVLSHPQSFRWAARLSGLDRRLRSGDYELSPSWSIRQLLEALASGRGLMLSVTIPEGLTLRDTARRLGDAGVTDGEAFLELAGQRDFLDSLGIPAATAEGFLFPETYVFASSSRPGDVLQTMTRQFHKVVGELTAGSPPEGAALLDLVTLASIVEKETALPEERPLVAAVFANRLRAGTRLQSDPTVIYGLEDFDGNLTRADLETPTPYNTYLIPGLPPGPIASPGRGSLWASLNPADVDYLYFVSRNDGSHQFSRSLAEHNRAVREYQLARGRR